MGTACSNNRDRAIDYGLPYRSGVVRALSIAVDGLLQRLYRHGRCQDNAGRSCVDGLQAALETQLELESAYLESTPLA